MSFFSGLAISGMIQAGFAQPEHTSDMELEVSDTEGADILAEFAAATVY